MKKLGLFLLALSATSTVNIWALAAPTKTKPLTAEQKRFIEATKKAFSKSPKATIKTKTPSIPTQTTPTPKSLTAEQKKLVSSAIKELRKLQAAVEVGLTNEKYTDRLIDAKAEIQDLLSEMPDIEVKRLCLESLANYEDANSVWSGYIKSTYVNVYMIYVKETLQKYNVELQDPTPSYASFSDNPIYKSTHFDAPISKIWSQASLNMNKAATLNK